MARKKTYWTPPRDPKTGAYKLREEWTKSEEKAYNKAKRDGLIRAAKQAAKMPRGPHGKFVSPTGKPSKKTKKSQGEVYVETGHVCPPCEPDFPGLALKVAQPLAMTTAQVAQIQQDIAEMKARLRLAPQQPTANPIETLAIVNAVGERDRGALDKLWESMKDNPLLAAAAVGVIVLVGYMMYRSWRRTQEQTGLPAPAPQPIVGGLNTPSVMVPTNVIRPAQVIPKHPTYRTVDSTMTTAMQMANTNIQQEPLPGLEGEDGDGDGIFA
jgi:hypothetical protein